MIVVGSATAEPDGSYRRYFLRVPPDTPTPRTRGHPRAAGRAC
jgi:hypothetical protein